MDSRENISRFAILIGIDAYPDKPLKGCVNDVRLVEAYLESISKEFIKIQTITAPSDNPMLWPTRENVISAFQSIVSQAKAGDFVYVHYSGHGTQAQSGGEFSNQYTGDLALVFLNKTDGEPTCLWGFELGELLKAMVDKGLAVTLVLDCCFSASAYRRDDPTVRFLPYDPKFDLTHLPSPERTPAITESHSMYRNASMRSNWLVNPDGYAILSACGPNEETGGYRFDGTNYGALSYFLIAILKCVGLTRRHKELHHHLRARFQGHNVRQTTILYGNKNQGFFGPVNSDISAAKVSVTKSNGVLQLEAGSAHGVNDGDRFILFPLAADGNESGPQSASVIAKVIQTRGLTSILEQEQSSTPARTGWMAKAETQACLRKYPILLEACLPDQEDWPTALKSRSLDAYISAGKTKSPFRVVLDEDRRYKILDEQGHKIIHLPSMPQAQTSAGQLGAVLEHLVRFRFARDIANDASTGQFHDSCDVHIRAGEENVSPGNLLEVKHGATVEVVIGNKSEQPVFVFIYNLGPLWQVQDIYHGVLVMPQGTRRKKLKLTVPSEMREKGFNSCEDIVKVFLTSRSTSFDILELPKLGGHSIAKRLERSGRRDGDATEDWATMNFLFRTVVP